MERLTELKPVFVDTMTDTKEHGKLYISQKYGCAIHLCACGCGNEVATPILGQYKWDIKIDNDKVTLSPSIGNFSFPCKSHYFIRENKIIWI